jgi:hypothetical protein
MDSPETSAAAGRRRRRLQTQAPPAVPPGSESQGDGEAEERAAYDEVAEFEEGEVREAESLPLRAEDMPAPLVVRRDALTDEEDDFEVMLKRLTADDEPSGQGEDATEEAPFEEDGAERPDEVQAAPATSPAAEPEEAGLEAFEDDELPEEQGMEFLDEGEDGLGDVEDAFIEEDGAEEDEALPEAFAPSGGDGGLLAGVEGAAGPSLDEDQDFWASLGQAPDEDDEQAPSLDPEAASEDAPAATQSAQSPAAPAPQAARRQASPFRRHRDPAPIDPEELARAQQERPKPHLDLSRIVNADEGDGEALPLATDEEHDEERWQPAIHLAARQATFAGPKVLSLINSSATAAESGEMFNHPLAAFADLEPGQKGFIRLSLRAYPEFKGESRAWLAARKTGQNPEEKAKKPHQQVGAWVKYFLSLLWYEANKAQPHALGGRVPPTQPGSKQGDVKPLSARDAGVEEAQAWKDAEHKVLAIPHYEADLRIGTAGRHEDVAHLERVADEIAAGFDSYTTTHQELVWGPADPYDTAIGCMGTKRREGSILALSADEVGDLARVPDDLARPHGVLIKRSHFKEMPLPNPIVVDDPEDPPPGIIPLGIANPRSEDALVFGMRVNELDCHAYITGSTGTGKATSVKTPIPTPEGTKLMGDLVEGDYVFDSQGRPTRVTHAFPIKHGRPTYELVFSDGSTIIADAEHKWLTSTRAERCSVSRKQKKGYVPKALPWLSEVIAAQQEHARRGTLQEKVIPSQLVSELALSSHNIWKAYRAIDEREVAIVPSRHDYGSKSVVKQMPREVVTRERMYEELCAIARRPLSRASRAQHGERGVRTTEEILATLHTDSGHVNHSVPIVAGELVYGHKEQPVDPYLLGVYLGDGSRHTGLIASSFEDHQELLGRIEAMGYEVTVRQSNRVMTLYPKGFRRQLASLGVVVEKDIPEMDKHIPEEYMRGDADQRWALLQGLMDTDGSVDRAGSCEFYSSDLALAEQVKELICGLGMQTSLRTKEAWLNGERKKDAHTLAFVAPRPAFRLARKLAKQKMTRSKRAQLRYIVDVRPVPSCPVRCISVEAPDHLYLAGRECIPTHNSEQLKRFIFGVAKANYPLVVIDPHGQLSDEILNALVINCPERLNDVVMCDLSDADWPVALNPLDVHHQTEIEPTVASIMEMLERQMNLAASGAPRAVPLAQQALSALCEANIHIKDPDTKCTLLNVTSFFIDTEFRRLVMEFCSNPSIRETFDPEKSPFETASESKQAEFSMPIIRAFQPLGSSDSFSAVFSSGENRLDFGKLISDRKIVLVKLASFTHQKRLGEFVGSLILPWLLSTMDAWGRHRDPDTGKADGVGCRVFVDEAPALIGPKSSAIELLAQSRKWDLGLITVSQYPSQFDAKVLEALLANTKTKLCLALDPSEAKNLAASIAGIGGKVTASDIAALPNYHYYGNVLLPTPEGGAAGSGAFSAACLPPIDCHLTPEARRLRELVIERSRQMVCNEREDIAERRQHMLDNIKGALQQQLMDRSEDGDGRGYSMTLDPFDDQATFGKW